MENVTTYFFSKILFLGAVLDVVDGWYSPFFQFDNFVFSFLYACAFTTFDHNFNNNNFV
jgi:hypothetical protein